MQATGRGRSAPDGGGDPRRRRLARGLALTAVAAVGGGALMAAGGPQGATAAPGWQWFKADFHVHSVLSADAFPDLGMISRAAKLAGYNAMFLTDHNDGSSFTISKLSANHMVLADTLRRWDPRTAGALGSSATELVTAPVKAGTHALHLLAASSSAGEVAVSTKRGPSLRSGDAVVTFSVNAKRIDAGGGLYVSASLGGDETVDTAIGYTTAAGVISPGKHTVFVWYFGSPPPASFNPTGGLIATNLATSGVCDRSFQLNAWITCTIRLNDALPRLAAADRPGDTNAWSQLKMAAVAADGTVEGYFDSYSIDAADPVPTGEEFVHRNGLVSQYDTASFKLLPAAEMGSGEHAQRFHYPIDDPADFTRYEEGVDGILPTQQAGYPAQLNHPGVDGGVSDQEAIDNNAFGADTLEVRHPGMMDDWDAILKKGVPLIGIWGSDNHVARWSAASQATQIYAPALTHDALLRSVFEGRVALALGNGPRVILNLDPASAEPYPARYPVHVSGAATSATVHLAIPGAISSGSKLAWIANDATLATQSLGSSFDGTRSVPLTGSTSYVRAEVRNAAGTLTASSQGILFVDVSGLPSGMAFHVAGVTTPNGRDYTRIATKGITAATWNGSARTLSMTLANPAGSLVEIEADTAGTPPAGVTVGGSAVPKATSRAAFDAATGSAWWFDGAASALSVKAKQGGGATPVVVSFAAGDAAGPSVPGGLSADAAGPNRVDVDWSAATDDVGVAGYTVYRDGAALATVDAPATAYADTSAAPSTTYGYAVDAFDAAGNRSARSGPVSATTPGLASGSVPPDADAYTKSDAASSNFGTSASLRVDADPTIRSWLRFTVGAVSGPVSRATLRIHAPNAHKAGYDLFRVASTSWGEKTVTDANAPAVGAKLGSSGPIAVGGWTSIDVTPYVTGNGSFAFALSGSSTTSLSLSSRESANPPQLVVESSAGGGDTTAPTAPSGLTAAAAGPNRVDLSWSAATDGVGVTGYAVFRNGAELAGVGGSTLVFSDLTAAPATTYSYAVEARDAAGNRSAKSSPASATTPAVGSTPATAVVADAYTSAATPTTNAGTATGLKADGSPVVRSWLRFTVSGLSGPATRATLRVWANSTHTVGYEAFRVADIAWGENTIIDQNAPAVGAKLGGSGSTTTGSWTTVDVTPYITGSGAYSFALTTSSGTNLSLASRESANDPQLVVEG